MPREGVIRLKRVSVVTADVATAERFYRRAFGFQAGARTTEPDETSADLLAVPGLRSRSLVLRLGDEELELLSHDPPGRAYPPARSASDPWFQHIAIVVADMELAYGALLRAGEMIPISTHGPEKLPANTGSVTVFKFRDPEGHPIELSMFPSGVGAARWHAAKNGANCLGIDHSAISVADVDRSLDFYCGVLGLSVASRSVNRGAEQDRLDGLASDGVDIVSLQPADRASPHIELLGYHPRGRRGAMPGPTDVAATRLTLEVDDLANVLGPLQRGGSPVSPAPVLLPSGKRAVLVRDPDGHLLQLDE